VKYLAILLLLVSSLASAECTVKYDRHDYKHWISTPESDAAGVQDVRQLVIMKAVVSGLKIENGRVVEGLMFDRMGGQMLQVGVDRIDVDHVVSLGFAAEIGAGCLTEDKRTELANDIDHLWPTAAKLNRRKGKRVDVFIIPNMGQCRSYLDTIKATIDKYGLEPTKTHIKRFKKASNICDSYEDGYLLKPSLFDFLGW